MKNIEISTTTGLQVDSPVVQPKANMSLSTTNNRVMDVAFIADPKSEITSVEQSKQEIVADSFVSVGLPKPVVNITPENSGSGRFEETVFNHSRYVE